MNKDKTILVDFHTHTSWSDGHSTKPELVRAAKEKNLWEIVITDHDDYRALSAKNIAENLMNLPGMREIAHNIYDFNGMKVSRGIELSCKDEERTVHIVGIYIDEPGDELKVKLAELRYKRIKRFRKIIKRLNKLKEIKELGIKFDVNKILMEIVSRGVPSRLHAGVAIAHAFEERGLYITPREAMNKYLHSKSPAYISLNDPVFPSPKDGIETILSLYGLPVLPHLVEIRDAGFDILEKIKEYCGYGLIGFEAKSGRRTDS